MVIAGGLWYIKTIEDGEAEEKQRLLDEVVKWIEMYKAEKNKNEEKIVEDVYTVDSEVLRESLENIGEMATAKYIYTNVGIVEDVKLLENTKIKLPGTQKIAVASMDGEIKVGIDIEDIKIHVSETKKIISIRLPKAKLLSNELDEKSLKVYVESSGVFSDGFTLKDGSVLRQEIKDKAEEKAKQSGLYEMAINNAETIIREIFNSIPQLKETYEIKFI